MPKRTMKSKGCFAVENSFVDNYLASADGTFVKIYLYALRHSGEQLDDETIAAAFGVLESDVVKAWKYWASRGLLKVGADEVEFLCADSPLPAKAKKAASDRQIMQTLEQNEELKTLYNFAQKKLGSVIPPSEIKILYSLHEDLHLPIEVIVMLFEYCSENLTMRRLEQTAVKWVELGLTTPEQVEAYCVTEANQTRAQSEFQHMAGISGRKLSTAEKNYINRWSQDFSMEMIRLAYGETTMNTGKLSFPYLDKILKNWLREGLTTPAAVAQNKAQRKQQSAKSAASKPTAAPKNNFNRYSAPADPQEGDALQQQLLNRRMKKSQS